MKNFLAITSLTICYFGHAQQITASFNSPDTICINQSFSLTNTSTGNINNYFWNICSGPTTAPTQTSGLANASYSLNLPVYLDVVKDGNNYHMFVTNNGDG